MTRIEETKLSSLPFSGDVILKRKNDAVGNYRPHDRFSVTDIYLEDDKVIYEIVRIDPISRKVKGLSEAFPLESVTDIFEQSN